MPVNSSQELHDLIHNLSQQFQNIHQTKANELWHTADTHINHVLNEGGNWITHEIQNLHSEWQEHLIALRNAENWFIHHTPLLGKIAQDAANLGTEFLA